MSNHTPKQENTNGGKPHICGKPQVYISAKDKVALCTKCDMPVDLPEQEKKCEHGNKGGCLACYKPNPQQADEWEKEFDEGCNTDNISDPPSDRTWIKSFITKLLTQEKDKAYKKGLEESQSTLLQSLADEVGQLDTGGSPCGGYSRGFYTAVIKASELILNRIKK